MPPFADLSALSWGSSINPAVPMAVGSDAPNLGRPTETARRAITLPPNLSKVEFERAIEDLKAVIGAEHVTINDGPLNDGNYYNAPLSHDTYAILDRDCEYIGARATRSRRTVELTRSCRRLCRFGRRLPWLNCRCSSYCTLGKHLAHPSLAHLHRSQLWYAAAFAFLRSGVLFLLVEAIERNKGVETCRADLFLQDMVDRLLASLEASLLTLALA